MTFDLKLESEARAFVVGHVSQGYHVCSGVPPSNHSWHMVLLLLTTVITTLSPALPKSLTWIVAKACFLVFLWSFFYTAAG